MKDCICAAVLVLLLCLSMSGFSQENDSIFSQENDSPWKVKGLLGINFTGAHVTDNWSGGETDSFGWATSLEASLERKWSALLFSVKTKLDYGRTATGVQNVAESADLIYMDSTLSYNMKWQI